jgi:hypothetical protein
MRSRRSDVLVTEFLRDALAADALGVPELEARGRAAGPLGERQRITDAKAFKRAKKSLGISSLRAGFGPRSQWRWQLPRHSETAIETDSGAAPERPFANIAESAGPQLATAIDFGRNGAVLADFYGHGFRWCRLVGVQCFSSAAVRSDHGPFRINLNRRCAAGEPDCAGSNVDSHA